MRKNILCTILLSFFFSTILKAQVYSFEDGIVPLTWNVTGGTLSTTTVKYKLGSKSLAWDWTAGSSITATNLSNLSVASTGSYGGMHFWVYNANPSSSSIKFSFQNSSNITKLQFDFQLNFKGWRCFYARFREDYGHDRSELTKMTIQAPASGPGTLYFDYIEFPTTVHYARTSDAQYRFKNQQAYPDLATRLSAWDLGSLSSVTQEQTAGVDTIAIRVDRWLYGTNQFNNAPEIISRKSAIQSVSNQGLKNTNPHLNLTMGADGVVYGPGLFSSRISSYVGGSADGVKLNTFAEVNRNTIYQVASDYTLNRTPLSKTRLFNILDWMYDQGWADGSSLGASDYEILGWYGYPLSVYTMRNELSGERLMNATNIMAIYGSGGLQKEYTYDGENVDIIRTQTFAKFAFALMQDDPKQRVEAMLSLKKFYEHAIKIHSGYGEGYKPDFSGYHHAGPYLSQYYPPSLYTACWVYYMLHDTPYALPDSAFNILKNALFAMRNVSATYSSPTATNGRFPNPGNTLVMQTLLPAFACLALSKPQPDTALVAAFKRLWTPTQSPVSGFISSAQVNFMPYSVGEIEMCLRAAALNIQAENHPKMALFMPYVGLMVNRNSSYLVSVKGFSKYVWDYERDVTVKDGLYNMFQSYGQIEYTNIKTGRRNNAYELNEGYDWSRLPGTTSKYLTTNELSGGNQRNFSDESFLGGAGLNDSVSMFSMKLHDNAIDKSFRANKSVFCFGNVLVCMGSNINNTSTTKQTETTLLQHTFNSLESLKVNGVKVTSNLTSLSNPIIRDNLGNRFLVKNGVVDVYKNGTLHTAVINHGKAPVNQKYLYYMLLNSNDSQESKYNNDLTDPISIIRQDSVAHIVKNKELGMNCYAIFDSNSVLVDEFLSGVNTPSVIMAKVETDGNTELVVSDPDLRRPSATDVDALGSRNYNYEASSQPFNYEITLNGLYDLNGDNSGVSISRSGNTTKISLTTVEGKAYKIKLKKQLTGLTTTYNISNLQFVETGVKGVFELKSVTTDNYNLVMTSSLGRVIMKISNLFSGSKIDTNGLPSGVYLVTLSNAAKTESLKIIVK